MTINAPLHEVVHQLHGKLGRRVHKIDMTSIRFSFDILDRIGDAIDEVRSEWNESETLKYFLQEQVNFFGDLSDHLGQQTSNRETLRTLLPYQTEPLEEEESAELVNLARQIAINIGAILRTLKELEALNENLPGSDSLLNPKFSLVISHPDEETSDE